MNQQYEQQAMAEMRQWQREMQRRPHIGDKLSKSLQQRINKIIPEKVHNAITIAFREMVNAVLSGSAFVGSTPLVGADLQMSDLLVRDKIKVYKTTAAAEGAITGAGGILLGLADFPIWLGIKMKLMSEIAALYGYDVRDYKERLFILYVFQLAFSGKQHRRAVYRVVEHWDEFVKAFPPDAKDFDWRTFQQEYRDYLDIAKLLQLIPGIGAVVGAYVNHKLTDKLGETAVNACRMRWAAKNIG